MANVTGRRTAADPLAPLPGTEGLAVAGDGTRLWYLDASGEGEAVLFLHGFSGSSSAAVHLVRGLAEAGLRPVLTDLRGHGYSDKPAGDGAYDLDRFATDAVTVLDACGIGRAHVVGHCLGGIVAAAVARDRPDRVASLTLVGTSMQPGWDQHAVAWAERHFRRLIHPLLRRLFPRDSRSARHVQYGRFRSTGDWYWPRMFADYRALSGDVTISILEMLDGLDLLRDADRIKPPTLIVHGARDTVFAPETAERAAAAIPGARLLMLRDDNHVTLVLEPGSPLFEAIVAHVRSHPA